MFAGRSCETFHFTCNNSFVFSLLISSFVLLFEGASGDYLMTASYDNTCKIWSHPTGAPIKTLAAHEGKIMCADLSPDLKYIATASFDRTFKLWAPENML